MAVLRNTILPSEAERFRYRWIVLICSFTVRMLVFGSLFSVGVLYVEWLQDFDTSRGEAAWVGSIATGTTLLMGPLASALLDRYSCRQVIVCSGVAMTIGLVISAFATNIPFLCVSFGFITGCAGGVANLAAVVSVSQYFDRQRSLAMGIGSGGVGVGAFLFGFLQEQFVDQYTWTGSLALVGAIQLHVVICGLLMMHPKQLRHYEAIWSWKSKDTAPVKANAKNVSNGLVESRSDNSDVELSDNIVILESCVEKIALPTKATARRRSTFQIIREKMKLTKKTISLLKNPVFWILFISDFLSWLVQFVPYVHLPERASMLGVEGGSLLLSLMGIANAVGKIGFGAFCTFFRFSAFKVFVVAQFCFGATTVLSPLCKSFWSMAVFATSFGFLSGSYGLMMVVPADLLGEELFALAYGFMLAGEGVGVYLGPPLVGWMSDVSNSYDSSLFIAGSVLLASALVLLLKPLIDCCPGRRRRVSVKLAWT